MLPLVVRPHAGPRDGIPARLSAGDRERLDSLGTDAAAAFLAGRAALLAAADTRVPDALIEAVCPDCGRSHGKPRLAGHPGTHLALSHAAGHAFAVVASAPVGIDAEPLDTDPARLAGAASLVAGTGDPLRRWTAVEAVLKADGRGLRVDPGRVRLGEHSAALDGRRYRLSTLVRDGCLVTLAQAVSEGSRG